MKLDCDPREYMMNDFSFDMNKPNNICQICFTKRPVRFRSKQLSICQRCIVVISEALETPNQIILRKQLAIEAKISREVGSEIKRLKKMLTPPPKDDVDYLRFEIRCDAIRRVARQEPLLRSIYRSLINNSARYAEADALCAEKTTTMEEKHQATMLRHANRRRETLEIIEAQELRRVKAGDEAAAEVEKFISEAIGPWQTKSAEIKLIRAASAGLIQWDLSSSPRLAGEQGDELTRRIRTRDGSKCVMCGRGFERGELHVHHVIHLSSRGTNNEINLVTLCYPCHNKQHDFNVTRAYPVKRRSPSHEFVAVDIETTGLSNSDGIIEIGAARFRDGKLVDSFNSLIRIGRPLPQFIIRKTGITDEMLAGAPDVADVMAQFVRFAGRSRLVFHNAPFDMRFLSASLAAHGYAVPNRIIDTLPMARKKLPELNNHKLSTLVSFFGLDMTPNHRTKADCIATGLLFVALRGAPAPKATSGKRRRGAQTISSVSASGLRPEGR